MTQIILIADPHGYPARYEAPASAAATLMICPRDKLQTHASAVDFPEAWLPRHLPGMTYEKRCWWVCDRLFAAAVEQLGLDADFYWCVEADLCALPDVWQRLIAAGNQRALDGIFAHLSHRPAGSQGGWFAHPTTPPWASHHCLGAIYRISRRAMSWIAVSAAENPDVFCEIHAPSAIHRAGGSVGDIKHLGQFYSQQTLRAPPHRCIPHPWKLNHPLKMNSAALPGF